MKRWVIGIALIFLALAALAGAGVVMLTHFALPWMTSRIEKSTGYDVRAESMDFNFSRGIVLEDVRVISPENKEVGSAERFYTRPNWGALIRRRELVIEEISIDLAGGQVRGQGQLSRDLDADVRVEYREAKARASAPPSGVLSARLIKGRGNVVARLSHGALQVSATAQIDVPGKTIEAVLRTGRHDWKPGQPQPWDIESLQVQLKGDLSRWNVQLLSDLRGEAFLRYRGTVEKREASWRVDWNSIVLHLPPETNWRTTRAGYAVWNDTAGITINGLQMSDGQGRLEASAAALGKAGQDITFRAEDVSLAPLLNWASPGRGVSGYLDGAVHLQGPATSPAGPIELVLSSGQVQGAAVQRVQAQLKLAPPWILIERVQLDVPQADNSVTASGRVPWHLVQPASPNLPMDVRIQTGDTDPRLLGSFIPGCEIEPGGHLSMRAVVQGLYPHVTVEGTATLKVPGLRYPDAGLDMKDVDVELYSRGKRAEVRRGEAKLGKGTLKLAGTVHWPRLDLTLTADKATFNIPKKLDLKTDGQLHLGGDLQAPELTGEIRPREGTYTQPKKEKKDKKEPAPAAKPSEAWKSLRLDIRTVWEHRLWYRDGLTKIETGGDLRVRKDRGAANITLIGPLSLQRGSYDAYGRDFIIDTGAINFTGPPDNPILSIQARYMTQDYQIFLSVTGAVKDPPRFRFTSSPPLSEQEIISVLVTGRSPKGGPSSSGSDDQARQAAADVASSYFTQTLRNSGLNLGLDVVRVTPTANGTVWTVGRYLRPDLFVSYGQNPKDSASSVVNADYLLNKRWTISTQASSTSDTYMDFLFRYPIKKRSSKK